MSLEPWLIQYILLLVLKLVNTETCEETLPDKHPQYTRSFLVGYDGPVATVSDSRPLTSSALGSCDTLENRAEKMIAFFTGFGVNLTYVRAEPHRNHVGTDYLLSHGSRPPSYSFRLLTSTLLDYSKYIDAPIYVASWSLRARNKLRGPRGVIPVNHFILYGNFRFKVDDEESCVEFKGRSPATFEPNTNTAAIDVILTNKIWGKGIGQGFVTLVNNATSYSMQFMMNFP